jgi:crotonobetainyl-CoA:carnitine CoA-transferase CaiB-like acyl-CoA transferase
MSEVKGIMDGITIVEMGAFINGTGAGAHLGDLGANVIKIEQPGRGDSFRGMAEFIGGSMTVANRNVGFEGPNRNKKSFALNTKTEEGKEILYKLVSKCDVFLTNYAPEVVANLGADYETLLKYNPKLIYAQATSFGTAGPSASKRSFDYIGQAVSGLMSQMGERDFPEPVVSVSGICDTTGSLIMAYGIVCALLARERFGITQKIDSSLMGSAIMLASYGINIGLLRNFAIAKHTRTKSRNPFSNYYRCKDDKWMMMCEIQSDRFWDQFCSMFGLPKDDPRFITSITRREHSEDLVKVLDEKFLAKTRDEWVAEFDKNKVEFSYSPIYDTLEIGRDPDALLNNYIIEMDHPAYGKTKMVGYPVNYEKTPAKMQREAPEVGQHTEEILIDMLGYTWDDIANLQEKNVI